MKNINMIFRISLLLIFSLIFVGCNEDLIFDKEDTTPPAITDFSPKTGTAGTQITITGSNLGTVDSVWIGGGLSEIKYRISNTQCVVVVTSTSKTGAILISGVNGKSETSESFVVQYAVPTISMSGFPTTAKPNDQIFIEGTNMDAVLSVMFGTTPASIIARTKDDIVVQVPFFDEESVDVIFEYNTAEGVAQTGTTGKPFTIEKVKPEVTNAPNEAEKGTLITLIGTNLSLVDEVWFGEYEGSISLKEDLLMTVVVPANFTATTEVVLKLVYNGTKELIVNPNFNVIVPLGPSIFYWENKTIYQQESTTGEYFFNAETGEIYSACDYQDVKSKITFFVSNSASSIQLNNPNNSDAQTKNFKCNGVALPQEKMPNVVRFRALNPANAAENLYIEAVKNKTLERITPQDIADAGITNAGTNGPRFYGAGMGTNQMNPGDVLLMQQFAGPETGAAVIKVGFIEIIKFTTTNPALDKASSMTFNCYFQN